MKSEKGKVKSEESGKYGREIGGGSGSANVR
jgi:hypothetical protein